MGLEAVTGLGSRLAAAMLDAIPSNICPRVPDSSRIAFSTGSIILVILDASLWPLNLSANPRTSLQKNGKTTREEMVPALLPIMMPSKSLPSGSLNP